MPLCLVFTSTDRPSAVLLSTKRGQGKIEKIIQKIQGNGLNDLNFFPKARFFRLKNFKW